MTSLITSLIASLIALFKSSRVKKHKTFGIKETRKVRLTIRIPADLHQGLQGFRERSEKSINDIVIEAIAQFIGMPTPSIRKGVPGPKPGRKKRRKNQET
jgi:hypothetical protein